MKNDTDWVLERNELLDKIDQLNSAIGDCNATLDLIARSVDGRALELYRSDPDNPKDTLPDYGVLMEYIVDRAEGYKALATDLVRRIDTLEESRNRTKRVVIRKLVQTCESDPSQWEGLTNDNREVYFRYRYGRLTASLGMQDDMNEFAGAGGSRVVELEIGDDLDGYVDYETLMMIAGYAFKFPNKCQDKIDWRAIGDRH